MAANASCGVWSTEKVAMKFWCFMMRSSCRRTRRQEARVLALERLGYTAAPALRNGLGSGIGEDILFVSLQPIEDSLRYRLGRGFRYLEASGHIGVNRAQEYAVDR